MTTYDLIVRDAMIFQAGRLLKADILVDGGRIAGITNDTSLANATQSIHAEGKIVIPGLVDTHAHLREPGYTHKEDFETGTKAAAAGGVTMLVDMPNTEPPTNSVKTLEEKKALASGKASVDFGHFVFPSLGAAEGMASAGASGFKVFMVRGAYPHDPRVCIEDHGLLLKTFREVRKTGLPCLVHPCDMQIFDAKSEDFWNIGRRDYEAFSEVYVDELIYESSISSLLALARETGVGLHLLHTHSVRAIDLIRKARQEGLNVSAQVDPKYFLLGRSDLDKIGPLAMPAGFFSRDRIDAVWKALNDGTISVLATDHAPHTEEEIAVARKDAWSAPFGSPQLEHYLSMMLTEVNKERITLNRLVQISCEEPSKLIGLYPKKGVIAVGSDADLTIIDLKAKRTITSEHLYTKVGWSPYEDKEVQGIPLYTILRGKVVMENAEVVVKPGYGKFTAPIKERM